MRHPFNRLSVQGHRPKFCVFFAVLAAACAVSAQGAEERTLSLEEVARNNSAESCYMVIEGEVYDVTKVMAQHRQKHEYDLLKWCGKESTRAWLEKDTKGKPHSRKAQVQLKPLRIGTLAKKARPGP